MGLRVQKNIIFISPITLLKKVFAFCYQMHTSTAVRDENLDQVELALRFWEIVLTSIEELGILKEELVKRQLLTNKKIGVSGTSMGGITTLGGLTTYRWIDAAAIMMGAPGFVELAKAQIENFESQGFELPQTAEEKSSLFENLAMLDITKNPAALNKRPIHFWHGKKDIVVPYEPTWNFYQSIKEDYKDSPRTTFIYNGSGSWPCCIKTGNA